MKRSVGIVLLVAFAVFAIVDTIHEFIANDTMHYFAEQPHRLLLVAAVGIAGGLVAFGLSALSPRFRRRAKLVALGSGGSFVIVVGCCFTFQFVGMPPELHSAIPRHTPPILFICTAAIAAMLWFEFYQILSRRDHVG